MITIVGSLNMDLLIRVERFPVPGETMMGRDFKTAFGGKGANVAYTAGKLSGRAAMIGCVGQDGFGDSMLANLGSIGVDIDGVRRSADAATGTALITLDASGQNEIIVVAGANATLTAEDVRAQAKQIQSSKALITQLETTPSATLAALELAHSGGVLTALNPSPFAAFPDEWLRLCDFLIPNETEATALTQVPVTDPATAAAAAKQLRARGAHNVLVTLGGQGVWIDTQNEPGMHIPGFKVTPVDTVGAGDTFMGAFVSRLTEGGSILDSARFGCAASAIAITRIGAQDSVPARSEVDSFLKKQHPA